MKKSIFLILFTTLLFSACGTMRLADVSSLSVGMTQNEVNQIMGAPIRVLSSSYTQDGRQDVYEYYTYRNEAYAIEFWDGRLSRYDFMYEDVPPAGIAPRPPYTSYPNRPSQPNRPETNRPSNTNRPSHHTSNSGRPTTRPSEDNKPGNSGRPSSSGSTERPTYGNRASSSRSSTPTKEQSKQTEENKDKK